jgi:hypothetical protein
MNHWIYDQSINPLVYAGFVYQITNLKTGQSYIGARRIYQNNGEESNWKDYWGSCKPLKEDITLLGNDKFKREIVSFHKMEELDKAEIDLQIQLDVLHAKLSDGSRVYYNQCIHGIGCRVLTGWISPLKGRPNGRKGKPNLKARGIIHSEETKKKMSRSQKGKIKSEETKQKISKSLIGKIIFTEDDKQKMSEKRKGVKKTDKHKQHMGKLTVDQVIQIKKLLADGLNNTEIAKQFGVHNTTIRSIRLGDTWNFV